MASDENNVTSSQKAACIKASTDNRPLIPDLLRNGIENEVAQILLQVLKDNSNHVETESWNRIEHGCFRLFLCGRSEKRYIPCFPILEGLCRAVALNTSISLRILSCIVLLSCPCVSAWITLQKSGILSCFIQLADIIAMATICRNLVWNNWREQDKMLISNALMELSILDNYEFKQYPTSIPITPLSVGLSRLLISASGDSPKNNITDSKSCLNDFVKRVPFEAWESVPGEHIPKILSIISAETDIPEVKLRFLRKYNLISKSSCGFISLSELGKIPVTQHLEKNLESGTKSINVPDPLNFNTEALISFENVSSIANAYIFVNKCKSDAREEDIKPAVSAWLARNKPELVAAAYVAAPQLLRQEAERRDDILQSVLQVPRSLTSEIDGTIDKHLAALLQSIPEIAKLRGTEPFKDYEQSILQLKRISILHPYLIRRRIACICAAGNTILSGLSTQSQRYNEQTLKVLEYLVGVISMLPPFECATVSDFCSKTFEFIIDEQRITNGIPPLLVPLAVILFKVMVVYSNKNCKIRMGKLLPQLTRANKSDIQISSCLQNVQTALKNSKIEMKALE